MTNNKPWLKKNLDNNKVEVMGAEITLKPITYGDSRKIMEQAMAIDIVTEDVKIDAMLLSTLRVLAQVDTWNLTDENDEPLPVTLETLDELDGDFVEALVNAVSVANKEKPQHNKKK